MAAGHRPPDPEADARGAATCRCAPVAAYGGLWMPTVEHHGDATPRCSRCGKPPAPLAPPAATEPRCPGCGYRGSPLTCGCATLPLPPG